ncbi:MAG: tRNA (N6-isopentenyl adenosine(37)-C2)-methylthiotransferase MiaB [Treponema sp.]|jgi:tRNA-2-methylthio-N6-dimethylallyladenosine synthase|nr:tRNA (N6-isopentenyl adenosine(37)-C2)-methylthiotransferase MiaB [Treponema sp.]
MTYFFETYGCQMNCAESAALKLAAQERGWTEAASSDAADLILINTCSVRATAERRVEGRLAQYEAARKKRPFTLVVAGCMAERLGETLKTRWRCVTAVMGPRARDLFPLILAQTEARGPGAPFEPPPADEKPVFSFAPSHTGGGESPFRSYIPVMHGCSNFCSYCIVPYVRGPEVSRPPDSILREIRGAAESGVREITLLGQNVNSYRWGRVQFPELLSLVADAIEGTPLRWVRFLSSHPKDLSDETIRVMAARPCFCRHLHLPVQHGSNRILAAMNRRYTREDYLALTARLRSAMPDLSLSTDILVGFPGETREDLDALLSLMEEARFSYAYMYHYNPREGTAAYALPNRVSESEKRARLAEVIALQKRHTRACLEERIGARAGARVRALVERPAPRNPAAVLARTERDEMVVFPGSRSLIGRFVDVRLEALRGNTLLGGDYSPTCEIGPPTRYSL